MEPNPVSKDGEFENLNRGVDNMDVGDVPLPEYNKQSVDSEQSISPDRNGNGNGVGMGAPSQGCGNVKIALKFLLSNVAAGIVIGKNGGNIMELQETSMARIQLSRNNVFYPGTVERVLLLTGTVKSVLVALYLILQKLTGRGKLPTPHQQSSGSQHRVNQPGGYDEHNHQGVVGEDAQLDCEEAVESGGMAGENVDEGVVTDTETTQVKIVMPAAVCGAIIGKGGETIKDFGQDSGASISVSPQERGMGKIGQAPGVTTDRIVTVTGSVSQILRAVALVVTVVAEDPNYVKNVGLSVNYAPRPASMSGNQFVGPAPHVPPPQSPIPMIPPQHFTPRNTFPGSVSPSGGSFTGGGGGGLIHKDPQGPPLAGLQPTGNGLGAAFLLRGSSVMPGGRVEVKLAVPDEHVGAIIGKGGEILSQLQCVVGVKVNISGRGEFEPGTRNRTVSISGPAEPVQIAQWLVTQKVNDRIVQLQRQGAI